MKKKIIILTLCFTLFFTSINYKKTYALDLVVTPTLLAITATLAVGTGIALKNSDDIYDIAKGLYSFLGFDKIKEMTNVLKTLATINLSGLITLPKEVHQPIMSYFDNVFKTSTSKNVVVGSVDPGTRELSLTGLNVPMSQIMLLSQIGTFDLLPDITFKNSTFNNSTTFLEVFYKGEKIYYSNMDLLKYSAVAPFLATNGNLMLGFYNYDGVYSGSSRMLYSHEFGAVAEMPYSSGSYDWDKVGSHVDSDGNLGIYVPGNVGDLVSNPPGDITVPNDGVYVPGGDLTIPGVSNPSIDLDTDITIPGVGNPSIPDVGNPSIPGVSQGVTDWIVSLVVPSVDYWNNKFNHYIDKIGSMLPVDIDYLKDMCVNGQPLPDFYINKNGVQMLVFSGKFANASANFIQVLFAGFSFVFLLLYNYSEVYKLIRGTRPFDSGDKSKGGGK